jgi:hypothetical protein
MPKLSQTRVRVEEQQREPFPGNLLSTPCRHVQPRDQAPRADDESGVSAWVSLSLVYVLRNHEAATRSRGAAQAIAFAVTRFDFCSKPCLGPSVVCQEAAWRGGKTAAFP